MVKKTPPDIGNVESDTISTPATAELPPEQKVFPDERRTVFYGRLLESIFADATYRKVLYETAMKELQRKK